MTRIFLKTLLGIVVLVVIAFVVKDQFLPSDVKDVKVRLGWVHQAQFAGMYVAEKKGYYRDAGLKVHLQESDPTVSQVEELLEGGVDMSVMEAHQYLTDGQGTDELIAIAVIYQENPHGLAVREDSDIYGPEDFGGKRIGITGGASEGTAIFESFVNEYGHADTVEYVELGFDTVEDFKNDRADIVDVYVIDQPYLAAQEGIPLRVITLNAYGFSTYGDVIVARRDFIEEYPDETQAFVQATLKGWEYALKDIDGTVDIVLPYTNGVYSDRGYQKHILLESITLVRGGSPQLGRMEFVPWSTLYETLYAAGVVSNGFTLNDIYTNEFIK